MVPKRIRILHFASQRDMLVSGSLRQTYGVLAHRLGHLGSCGGAKNVDDWQSHRQYSAGRWPYTDVPEQVAAGAFSAPPNALRSYCHPPPRLSHVLSLSCIAEHLAQISPYSLDNLTVSH